MRAPNLSELIDQYLQYKRGEGLKPYTIETYRMHLRLFLSYLSVEQRVMGGITARDIAAYLASEAERGMSISTRRSRHRAIDMFYNWLSDQDDYGNPVNPLRRIDGRLKIKPPEKKRQQPRRAKLDHLLAVIKQIPRSNWIGLRDRAMLMLAMDTGLRIGELISLRVEDINIVRSTVHVVSGKRDKERFDPFTLETATALALYLMSRPTLPDVKIGGVVRPDPDRDRLWLSAVSERAVVRGALTVRGAQVRMRKLCAQAGVSPINWHSIRHFFGTKALNDGMRLEVVSLLMGHSDVSFTRRMYADLLPSTALEEYNQKWSRQIV